MRRRSVPFKIFGLQRTGTNLVAELLRRNFLAKSIEPWTDWKHGRVQELVVRWKDLPVRYVICGRNPYAWLGCCYRYFKKAVGRDPTLPQQFQQNPEMSFEQFVRTASYEFRNPIDRWNHLYCHWQSALPHHRTAIVKQEDLLTNQTSVLKRLQHKLVFPARSAGLRPISKRIDIIPNNPEALRHEYFLDREYMIEYTQSLLEFVNGELDRSLLKNLGYELERHALEESQFDGFALTVRSSTTDAAIAGATISDLYDFTQINRWSSRIEKIVEFGAGIGTSALLAKQYWPKCQVRAYEGCPQELRVLRANARRVSGVTPMQLSSSEAAVTELGNALKTLGGEIDVLRLGCADQSLSIIRAAHAHRFLERIRWIRGKFANDPDSRSAMTDLLGDVHFLTSRPTPTGDFFLARRLHTPRVRAESAASPNRKDKLTERTAYIAAKRFMASMSHYLAGRFRGRGVVICAGGRRYFPCAWVCINMLRHVGLRLPIEMWALNSGEIDSKMRELLKPLEVRCIDASRVRKRHPARILDGWELKPYAIIHSRFREVLFMDADNVAIKDPAVLFESPEYRKHGAVFWPAYRPFPPDNPIWKICHVKYREEPDFETGQILIDKSRCWKALQLTMHLNENSDFYYEYTQGDKETFHMAWRMLGQDYVMIPTAVEKIESTACQHDFQGDRMFQHRYQAKWKLDEANPVENRFLLEDICFRYLDALGGLWNER
jgi:hypothetical protein